MPSYSGIWTLQQQMQARGDNLWPAPPGAPTIGTATQASSTSVSVTFTAPSNLGIPAVITGYTVTSSPGGITGTGASSPVVVSGLTTGTAYTFTVTATNATGTGPASAASNSVTPMPAIGAAYEGGFYAGQISTVGNSIADYNLVVGPLASANSSQAWKTTPTTTPGTLSQIDGPTNSSIMNNASHPAAQFCEGLTIGGYSDWYMPAKNELEVCYYNLKPATTSNSLASGVNLNAVPARASTYTAGTPAQTSATNFQSPSGAERFSASNGYWSSTEYNASNGTGQYIGTDGSQYTAYKPDAKRVRAIRRVAV